MQVSNKVALFWVQEDVSLNLGKNSWKLAGTLPLGPLAEVAEAAILLAMAVSDNFVYINLFDHNSASKIISHYS